MTQSIRCLQMKFEYTSEYLASHSSIRRSRSAFAFCTISTIIKAITAAKSAAIAAAHTFAVLVMAHSVQAVTP